MKKVTAEDVLQAIDDGYNNAKPEKARAYIGASIIGNRCDAMIAYALRKFPNNAPDPRLKRIFNMGHMLESMVVKDLKKRGGFRVWEVDSLTGKQHEYVAWGGHVACHLDGHVALDDGDVRILEIKSMNDASFTAFKKQGIKFAHPHYFGQAQMMMGMSKIPSCLFIAINKNNAEYHAEIVDYDAFEFAYIKERIERVLNNQAEKISTDETDWRCRACVKRGVCWEDTPVPVQCATCQQATPKPDGNWHCHTHDKQAITPCSAYKKYAPKSKGDTHVF